MIGPASRRGFLRGLTTLPLIGGGVALIGAPSAVAEPVTLHLLREYHDWLMYERSCLTREMLGPNARQFGEPLPPAWRGEIDNYYGAALRWHRARGELRTDPEGEPMGDGVSFPSTRAALVLSAVGCDWRRGGL